MDKRSDTGGGTATGRDNKTRDEVNDMEERDEIVKMWKHMDEKLEQNAKSLNLTAVNVKSILHHMIKNPQLISMIVGLDKSSATADLKLTRSKTKHLLGQETHNDPKEAAALPRASRTFLDIDYETNEDDDGDYLPEQGDNDTSEGEAGNEHDIGDSAHQIAVNDNVAPALHTRSKQQNSTTVENEPTFGDDVLLYSTVDDPEYVEFISSLNDPTKYDHDEAEDPEYNFLADKDAEDMNEEYEIRKDRATEIPLREVENLLQDLYEARLLPSPEHLEQTFESDENKEWRKTQNELPIKEMDTAAPEILVEDTKPTIILVNATLADFLKRSAQSSSLIGVTVENPPFFSFNELQQLVTQLEKHVQLLTQFAVGCYFEKTMVNIYNGFQLMINELNDYSLHRAEHSLFNVSNLQASIETCHDAINCESVTDFAVRPRNSTKLQFPLPEAMLVLSRSRALPFPELFPQVRLKVFLRSYQCFTAEEECLLALGLYQFAHLKQPSRNQNYYGLIKKHLLANKRQSQIRLHLKNLKENALHTIFMKAEKEMIDMIFPLEDRSSALPGPPYSWPEHLQPKWLQELVIRQQQGPLCENVALDGLHIQKIGDQENSSFTAPPDPDHIQVRSIPEGIRKDDNLEEQKFNRVRTPTSAAFDCNSSLEAVTDLSSVDNENNETNEIAPSPVRNLLFFASAAVCNEKGRSPLSESHQSEDMLSTHEVSGLTATSNTVKQIKLAPFKRNPVCTAAEQVESEGSIDSSGVMKDDTCEKQDFSEQDFETNSSISSCSSLSSVKFRQYPKYSKYDKYSNSNPALRNSLRSTANPECSWSSDTIMEEKNGDRISRIGLMNDASGLITGICGNSEGESVRNYPESHLSGDTIQKSMDSVQSDSENSNDIPNYFSPVYSSCSEHVGHNNDSWVPKTPGAATDTEWSVSVRFLSEETTHHDSKVLADLDDKGVQCELLNTRHISRVSRGVQCNEFSIPKDGEEIGKTGERDKQAVSGKDSGDQRNRSVGNDRQEQSDSRDDNDPSLLGNQKQDEDSDEEKEQGSTNEEKRRRRTHKERLKDGLRGMLDAQHRARQVKCMARVIFNDFRQRMFMYQDKVRSLYELIVQGTTSVEMFEKMQDIFEEEHKVLYYLLSFLFPQNLLPTNVLENPIRKAYVVALEMIYNIEAFTSFGNSRFSGRSVFRCIRDLGLNCTAEALARRLYEVIGSEEPLWEIVSRNIPAHICQTNYSQAEFEYIDLDNWNEDEAPFENIDLTVAIGAQTAKRRSGVFVGFLRSLYTERKGKLYEVVAEWKPIMCTPPARLTLNTLPSSSQSLVKRTKRRKHAKARHSNLHKSVEVVAEVRSHSDTCLYERDDGILSVNLSKNNPMAIRFLRKRSMRLPLASEKKGKRIKSAVSSVEQERTTAAVLEGKEPMNVDYDMDSTKIESNSTTVPRILLEDAAGSSATKNEQIEGSGSTLTVEPFQKEAWDQNKKWTIEEDRIILYTHREYGPDIEDTVAKVCLELPEVPVDQLRRRLIFLLGLLQELEIPPTEQI